MKQFRVAIYARVSTDDQSVGLQLSELREYIALRKWTLQGEYIDEGMSGGDRTRPKLKEVLDLAKKGKIDMMLVWRFDRAARSTAHMIEILETLQRHDCEFCSMQEQIDTSSATGRLLFTLIAAFGEFEKQVIQERTIAGLKEARRRGVVLGRPKAHQDIPEAAIREALEMNPSLRSAAKALDMPLTTLRGRIKELGIVRIPKPIKETVCEENPATTNCASASSSGAIQPDSCTPTGTESNMEIGSGSPSLITAP